jgi:hypothetical protein
MPKHLEVYTLKEPVRELVEDLGRWLERHGSFVPGVPNYEKCTSINLEKQVGELWAKITALFNEVQLGNDVRSNTSTQSRKTKYICRRRNSGEWQGHSMEEAG